MRAAFLLCSVTGLASAQFTTITFDDLSAGTSVTNQYPEVTFSASFGQNTVLANAGATSGGHILCTTLCIQDTYLDFTAPVSQLTFWAIAANAVGQTAFFNVYTTSGFEGTVPLISSGGSPNNEFVDLTAFNDIVRVEIVDILDDQTNENGIGWDTFRFIVPAPAPAALALASLGLAAGRRR